MALVRERAWTLVVWAAMVGWTAVLFVHRSPDASRTSARGGSTSGTWCRRSGARRTAIRSRSTARRDGRADGAPRWSRRSVPRAAHAALDRLAVAARARVRADRGRVARSAPRVLARPPAPRLRERRPALLALGYLAYPWTATSAVAAIHPVTFAIPLFLFCIWFLDTDRLVPFAVCARCSRCRRASSWGCRSRRWESGTRSRAEGGAPARAIALLGVAWTFVAIYVVVPAFAGEDSIFFGFYDQVGGSPGGVVQDAVHGSRRGPRRAGRGARHRVPRLARAAAPLPLRALARARGRRASAAARERALGLPLDDGPALPQRRGGDPVPHRRDGLRHRADRRAAPRPRRGRGAGLLGARSRSSWRPGPRAVGAAPLGGRAYASATARRGARRMPSRSCPRERAVMCVERRRRPPLGAPLRLLGARTSGGPSGSSSTAAIRGSCAPTRRSSRGIPRSCARSSLGSKATRRGRRSSSETASSSSGSDVADAAVRFSVAR